MILTGAVNTVQQVKALAFHVAKLGSIPGILDGALSTARVWPINQKRKKN